MGLSGKWVGYTWDAGGTQSLGRARPAELGAKGRRAGRRQLPGGRGAANGRMGIPDGREGGRCVWEGGRWVRREPVLPCSAASPHLCGFVPRNGSGQRDRSIRACPVPARSDSCWRQWTSTPGPVPTLATASPGFPWRRPRGWVADFPAHPHRRPGTLPSGSWSLFRAGSGVLAKSAGHWGMVGREVGSRCAWSGALGDREVRICKVSLLLEG